jgi:hypothetical protein
MAKHKIGYIDEPFAIYNHHASFLTKNVERYYHDTIKMYSQYLNSEIVDREIINDKMSILYFSLGYHYIWKNNLKGARRALIRSLRYDSNNLASIKCLLMSFIPLRLLSVLKNVFRQKTLAKTEAAEGNIR